MLDRMNLYDIFLKHPVVATDSKIVLPALCFLPEGKIQRESLLPKRLREVVPLLLSMKPNMLLTIAIFSWKMCCALCKNWLPHRKRLGVKLSVLPVQMEKQLPRTDCSCFKEKYRVRYPGNLNNHIGVPLTLYSLPTNISWPLLKWCQSSGRNKTIV